MSEKIDSYEDRKRLSVAFGMSDATMIQKVSESLGETVSSFVRRSVRKELARLSLLSDFDKRILGRDSSNEPVNELGEANLEGGHL